MQPSTANSLVFLTVIKFHHLITKNYGKTSEFQGQPWHLQWLALAFAQVHDQDEPIALHQDEPSLKLLHGFRFWKFDETLSKKVQDEKRDHFWCEEVGWNIKPSFEVYGMTLRCDWNDHSHIIGQSHWNTIQPEIEDNMHELTLLHAWMIIQALLYLEWNHLRLLQIAQFLRLWNIPTALGKFRENWNHRAASMFS